MILYGDPLSDLIRIGETCRTDVRRPWRDGDFMVMVLPRTPEDEGGVDDGGEHLDEAGDHQPIGLRDDLCEAAMEK